MNDERSQFQPSQARKHHPLAKSIGFLLVTVIAVLGVLYGPQVYDRALALQFTPSPEVRAVSDRLQLSTRGKDLLYASRATIENKTQFNAKCESGERTAAILGCYYKRNIYLYDVNNPDLDGAIEVTAAHEMLHAAYERLNFIERIHVDNLIKDEYSKLKRNPAIAEEMAYYQQAEPGAEINELHSIIGTTVADISPELEKYYAQYFNDRAAIVALNDKYNAVFTRINNQANDLQAEINRLKPVVQSALAAYDEDRRQLESDIKDFNDKADSGGFTTQYNFNIARNSLEARANALNARMEQVNDLVASYNTKIQELNALSVKAGEYNESINGAEATTGVS